MTTHYQQTGTIELIDYLGYRIRLCRTPVDWVAFIIHQGQHQMLVVAPERDPVLVMARQWIDEQLILRAHDLGAKKLTLAEHRKD
jgi:hypothetical protein